MYLNTIIINRYTIWFCVVNLKHMTGTLTCDSYHLCTTLAYTSDMYMYYIILYYYDPTSND